MEKRSVNGSSTVDFKTIWRKKVGGLSGVSGSRLICRVELADQ